MDVSSLVAAFETDLQNTYGLRWTVSVCETGEGDINFEFVPAADCEGNCVIGFRLYLLYTSVSMELTAINPPPIMDPVFISIAENGKNHIAQIAAYEGLLLSKGGEITYQINGKCYCNESLQKLCTFNWASFSARYDSGYVNTHYRLDFNYQTFRQIVLDFAGYILLFSSRMDEEASVLREEGQAFIETGIKYERNPINRRLCLRVKGYNCSVCGLNLEDRYGSVGKEYIEVHHVIPVSEYGGVRLIDPVTELFPVCPNCHAMLHRRNPPYSIDELKYMIAYAKEKRRGGNNESHS